MDGHEDRYPCDERWTAAAIVCYIAAYHPGIPNGRAPFQPGCPFAVDA
jgi:hypothetical protein